MSFQIELYNESFQDYALKFYNKASLMDLSEEYILECLEYSHKLNSANLPIIYDGFHFSQLVGIESSYVYTISNSSHDFYRYYDIKKKNGKTRKIAEPFELLKEIQKWILNEILLNIETSKYSKAYKKNFSIKDNARFHQNQNVVICMDIKSYFPSIKISKVFNFFRELGYNEAVATLLSELCCLNGSLPQGAPTSPCLSNLLSIKLDDELANLAELLSTDGQRVRYSRYSDDITFSGNNINPSKLIPWAYDILRNNGFQPNLDKTRVLRQNTCQMVTGIVVNKKMQVSKRKRLKLRQQLYYINKFGLLNHMANADIDMPPKKYLQSLLGQVNFVCFLNPKDSTFKHYSKYLKILLKNFRY
ncbi:MAG: reverse transcriptase family protein [Tissierellales bacterium]|jgi:RNA-directed DNA polymerase|nr:reverse transcriptase family protein [Tissierellales bacterium]